MKNKKPKFMAKAILVTILGIIVLQALPAQKLGTLTGLTNPFSMAIEGDRIYIVDGGKVSIFSLKDRHLIRQFGKKGEGPGEFMVQPTVNMGNVELEVYSDYLTVTSITKFSFFSKDGIFKKEFKTLFPWACLKPIADRFVGIGRVNDGGLTYNTLKIQAAGLEEGQEFFRQRSFISSGVEMNPYHFAGPFFYIVKDSIYVEYEKDEVRVYDRSGKQTATLDINQGYQKVAVSSQDREAFHTYLKTEPAWREHYPGLKSMIKFPGTIPGIKFFHLAEGIIYIVRWTGQGDLRDLALFDLRGKWQKNTRIPLLMKDTMMPFAFTFHAGALYQLIEDSQEEGTWILQKTIL